MFRRSVFYMRKNLDVQEIKERLESDNYRSYDDIDSFFNIVSQYQVDESGICFFDKDNTVINMVRMDLVEETSTTMQKVIAVCDLGEEEISKFNKVRHIIKGFLEICFRKKITVFLLSMAFIYMNYLGIKEKMFLLNIMYTGGFFMITDVGNAINWVKQIKDNYKLRDEALADKEFMEFFSSILNDDVHDMNLYLRLRK